MNNKAKQRKIYIGIYKHFDLPTIICASDFDSEEDFRQLIKDRSRRIDFFTRIIGPKSARSWKKATPRPKRMQRSPK